MLQFGNGVHVMLSFDIVESFKRKHEVIESFHDGICRSDSWFHDVLLFEEDSI